MGMANTPRQVLLFIFAFCQPSPKIKTMNSTLQSDYVSANGLRLHYLRTGNSTKPLVLCLHGITDSGACWTPVIEALRDDYDFIAPDARGHGLSDAPSHGYSAQHHADDAAALIQALSLDKPTRTPIVIGHSMGGATATALAAQHPSLVRAVVVEDPAWFDPSQRPPETRGAMSQEWRARMRTQKTQSANELIAAERLKNPRWSDGELNPWSQAKHQVHEQVLDYVDEPPPDWRAQVQAIQCPILLVTGDVANGVIITPQQAAAAQAMAKDLRIANIPNTGHCIRRDDFAGFVEAVAAFLKSI
jgi:pimeloyl-ACP methyl ester carboxylesterase